MFKTMNRGIKALCVVSLLSTSACGLVPNDEDEAEGLGIALLVGVVPVAIVMAMIAAEDGL